MNEDMLLLSFLSVDLRLVASASGQLQLNAYVGESKFQLLS